MSVVIRQPSWQASGLYLLAAAWGLSLAGGTTRGQIGETELHRVGEINFRTPRGLIVERVAASPLVARPIVATWDDAGRLVVLEAAGPVDPEAEANGSRPHRLVRLVDRDGDGVFDQRIVAAEDLRFPVGVLCRGTSTLVSSPPEIWNLIDADGDGVCERREVWFDPGTVTHCRNDLHGPFLGLDGWIYWCKGAFAEQAHAEFNGQPLRSTAAHIFRRRFAGGQIEAVMTGGMDNPVEVAFAANGERFFTSTFVQHPGGGRRDGIVHAVYGGVYGKPHAPLAGHLRTGPLLPIMTHLGPAAPSGLWALRDPALLTTARIADSVHMYTTGDFLVATQFNLQKVSVHRLVPEGASYRTEDHDLLVADRVEFHPTDVLEDADGSLLICDTGGWYDLCCPSSALDQTIATGGIYRLSRADGPGRVDPRGDQLAWDHLQPTTAVARLASPSWWIAERAARWLQQHPLEAEAELRAVLGTADRPLGERLAALWLLCQAGRPGGQEALVATLSAPAAPLRHAAAIAIGLHRWPATAELAERLASDSDPGVRRAAAEALGRIRDPASCEPLLQAIAADGVAADRMLEHSILFALLEIGRPEQLLPALNSTHPQVRRAALRVLSELQSPDLRPAQVVAALTESDPQTADLALEILQARPEWAGEAGPALEPLWAAADRNEVERRKLGKLLAAWWTTPVIERQVAEQIESARSAAPPRQATILALLSDLHPARLPARWSAGLAAWIQAPQTTPELRLGLFRWLDPLELDPHDDRALVAALVAQATPASAELETAIAAIRAAPARTPLDRATVARLVAAAVDDRASPVRAAAIQALPLLQLTAEQGDQFVQFIQAASGLGPTEFAAVVSALAGIGDDSLDRALLERLPHVPAARTLAPDFLSELYQQRSAELQQAAGEVAAQLAQPPAEIAAALARLEQQLPTGDPLRGMQVFRSAAGNCSVCHQVAYVGGTTGPDLSRIGATRTRRELLESIAYPNQRLEQSYRPWKIVTLAGKTYNGLIEREDGESLELVTGPDQRVRLAVAEIDERKPSAVSVMPSGMLEQLTLQQWADLTAFLESRR